MIRMTPRMFGALVALVIPTLASAQTSGDEYVDPEVYQVEAKFPVVTYPSGYSLNDNYPWEASATFDPRYQYSEEEKQAILAEEARLTGGRLTTDVDGSPLLEITQPEIPEASRDTAPPPDEIFEQQGEVPLPQLQQGGIVSPTSTPLWMSRRYLYSKSYGNNIFGAGYSIDTFVKATEATSTAAKKVSAYVEQKVTGKVFNASLALARARMDVAGQGSSNSGTAKLYALGQQVYSKALSGSFSLTPVNVPVTFGSYSKWFMVGPVPVKLKASLGGGVKLSLSGKISGTEAKLYATPGAYVNVSTSAGVDVLIVAFGVSGSLNLINVSNPATAELIWPYCSGLTWKLASSVNLNTLSGNIKLWARVWFIFFSKTWYLTVANWPGITHSASLFNISGAVSMGICPGYTPAAAPLASMTALK